MHFSHLEIVGGFHRSEVDKPSYALLVRTPDEKTSFEVPCSPEQFESLMRPLGYYSDELVYCETCGAMKTTRPCETDASGKAYARACLCPPEVPYLVREGIISAKVK